MYVLRFLRQSDVSILFLLFKFSASLSLKRSVQLLSKLREKYQNRLFSVTVEEKTKVWSDALKVSLPARKTWETLGILVSKPEPPFISYAGPYALLQLDILVTLYQDIFNASHSCDPEPTSRADFLKDILLLLTGIASQNFPFDEV